MYELMRVLIMPDSPSNPRWPQTYSDSPVSAS